MKVLNILVRRCVLITRFEETVSFYENLIAQKARLRFDYPEYDLKLAQVGSVLLIGGTEQSLAPFRATEATFLVNDITAWEKHLPSTGATIINPVKAVPTMQIVRRGGNDLISVSILRLTYVIIKL